MITFAHTKPVDTWTQQLRGVVHYFQSGPELLKTYCAALDDPAASGPHPPLTIGSTDITESGTANWPVNSAGNFYCGSDSEGYLTHIGTTMLQCDETSVDSVLSKKYKLTCDPTLKNASPHFHDNCPDDYPLLVNGVKKDGLIHDWGAEGASQEGFGLGLAYFYGVPTTHTYVGFPKLCCKPNFELGALFTEMQAEILFEKWRSGFDQSQKKRAARLLKVEDPTKAQCLRNDPCAVRNAHNPSVFTKCKETVYGTACFHGEAGTLRELYQTSASDLTTYTAAELADLSRNSPYYTPPADAVEHACPVRNADGTYNDPGAPNRGVTVALPVVGTLATAATIVYVRKKQLDF